MGRSRGPQKRGREGKKTRKYGRNLKKCAAYRAAKKHEKSHVRRLEKHLNRFPGDGCAEEALGRYRTLLRG